MTKQADQVITIVTVADRADFSKTLDQMAFASRHHADQWAVESVEYWGNSFKNDGVDCFDIKAAFETMIFDNRRNA